MKVYKLKKDFKVSGGIYHTFKKGERFFYKKDSLGHIFTPESGFYPLFGDVLISFRKDLIRVPDLPYNPEYYINKKRIAKIRAENKAIELKFNKKKLHL